MASQRIIFLDFDGVLNSRKFLMAVAQRSESGTYDQSDAASMIDPEAIIRLNAIIAASGAKIVISSSWRHIFSVGALSRVLREMGLKGGKVIGATPGLFMGSRGQEINAWLLENSGEYESFVILDDSTDMMSSQLSRFVQTAFDVGMTDQTVNDAIKILMKPCSHDSEING